MSTLLRSRSALSDRQEILQDIADDDCNLAIWQRDVPIDAGALFDGDPENLRVIAPGHNPGPVFRDALDRCAFPDGAERDRLSEDMLSLCAMFHALTACQSLEIRLEIISGNACWKFHSDYVDVRLITTYFGRGTQWVDADDLDRFGDGLPPESVQELACGDVGLFKGRRGSPKPAIHRSPPIEGTGEKRLLLVLNSA